MRYASLEVLYGIPQGGDATPRQPEARPLRLEELMEDDAEREAQPAEPQPSAEEIDPDLPLLADLFLTGRAMSWR